MASTQSKKVVVVGDEQCGKTGLIYNFFTDALPDPAVPTIYKEYPAEVDVDGKKVPIELWIIPAQDHYRSIRTLTYSDSKAVILCFAIDNPASLTRAAEMWYPEIKKYLPDVPIVLVGNKIDLRSDENIINELASKSLKPVSLEEGKKLADDIKAEQYIECSAKNGDAVKDVFKAAAKATLKSS